MAKHSSDRGDRSRSKSRHRSSRRHHGSDHRRSHSSSRRSRSRSKKTHRSGGGDRRSTSRDTKSRRRGNTKRHGTSPSRSRSRSPSSSPVRPAPGGVAYLPSQLGGSGSGSTVLEACWKPVQIDPTNFDAWTHLLQCVENLDDLNSAKDAFDPFLAKFPYCFGYWRKYAEMYRKHEKLDMTLEIYERGVNAVPLSVDLWLGFLSFYKELVKDDDDAKKAKIQNLYERAVEAAGLEFRSDKLWEDYVAWLISVDDYKLALNVYDRIVATPLLLYSTHFDKFQDFVNLYEPHEILSTEEFDEYYKDIEDNLKPKGQEILVAEENEIMPNSSNGNDDVPHTGVKQKYDAEALKLVRITILEKRRKVHLKTEQEVSKRWTFEENIKRPYFHVKPLERAQLKNWRQYLDFEMEFGDKTRTKTLFERCLVACAMYEDIWLRYARYMDAVNEDEARDVYRRACEIFLPHKANMHLSWACFEEKRHNYDQSERILTEFESKHGPSVLVKMRRINMHMRRIMLEKKSADSAIDQNMNESTTNVIKTDDNDLLEEKSTNESIVEENSEKKSTSLSKDFEDLFQQYDQLISEAPSIKTASFYATKFARFMDKICMDSEAAEKILNEAIVRDPKNGQLHLQLAQMAIERRPFDLDAVLDVFDKTLENGELLDGDKLTFSQRKLELLEDFSDNVERIQRHYESHIKLCKNLGLSTSKKRPSSSSMPSSYRHEDKRQRYDVLATPIAPSPIALSAKHGAAGFGTPTLAAAAAAHHHHMPMPPAAGATPAAPVADSSSYYGYYLAAGQSAAVASQATSTGAVAFAPPHQTYGYYAVAAASTPVGGAPTAQ